MGGAMNDLREARGRMCQASRAVFYWAAATRRISWPLYNHLMTSVSHLEKMLLGCQGKVGFLSYDAADKIARQPGHDGHIRMRIFKCEVCNRWHLTSLRPRQDRRSLRVKARRTVIFHA
jgi:hypothetical protein